MVLLGVVASQRVLATLSDLQNERLREVAQSHVDGLQVALAPFVLRRDVWEVYDALDRTRSQTGGARVNFTAVSDDRARVLAATDPKRAAIDDDFEALLDSAVPVKEVTTTNAERTVRIVEPLFIQDREVGRVLTELDVSDLVAQRRNTTIALLAANFFATSFIALAGYFLVARLLQPVELLTSHIGMTRGAPERILDTDIQKANSAVATLMKNFNEMVGAIQARGEAEKRLADRERFVSLGRLSSSLAHEINNPLGGLLNTTDTIRTYADRPDVVRQSADILDRGLKHMRDVSQAILHENRVDRSMNPLTLEDFDDIKTLMLPETTRQLQELQWDVTFGDFPIDRLPAAPVRQICLNLLLNSSTAAGRCGRLEFRVFADGERLCLQITDDGPGLNKPSLARLLSQEPVEPGGGVGLRLVGDLVHELGGILRHERTAGTTVISIHLCARDDPS